MLILFALYGEKALESYVDSHLLHTVFTALLLDSLSLLVILKSLQVHK